MPQRYGAPTDAAASAEKRLYEYDGHGHDAGSHRHREIVAQFFAERLRP